MNLAIITVGQMSDETNSRITGLCAAAHDSGDQGLHIQANDANGISQAFDRVSTKEANE